MPSAQFLFTLLDTTNFYHLKNIEICKNTVLLNALIFDVISRGERLQFSFHTVHLR